MTPIISPVQTQRVIFALFLWILPVSNIYAQCQIENVYFQSGEVLSYNLYFKYGIIYKKVGVASMSVTDEKYDDQNALKMSLIANSTGLVKSFFALSDTLVSYMTRSLIPLAYTKDAHEEKDHSIERANYEYSSDIRVRNVKIRNDKLRYDTILTADNCMYDVISIVYYARTLDYDKMKKGDRNTVSFFSGPRMMDMDIEHSGIETVSASNDYKYSCIKLTLLGDATAFEDKNELMTVYLTNDLNRIPIRIESKLKLGKVRVVLDGYKGQKN